MLLDKVWREIEYSEYLFDLKYQMKRGLFSLSPNILFSLS